MKIRTAAVAATLMLVGCAPADTSGDTAGDTAGGAPTPHLDLSAEYGDLLRDRYPNQAGAVSDADLMDLGLGFCETAGLVSTQSAYLEAVLVPARNVDPSMEWLDFIAYASGAALPAFCPEHAWLVQ